MNNDFIGQNYQCNIPPNFVDQFVFQIPDKQEQ